MEREEVEAKILKTIEESPGCDTLYILLKFPDPMDKVEAMCILNELESGRKVTRIHRGLHGEYRIV